MVRPTTLHRQSGLIHTFPTEARRRVSPTTPAGSLQNIGWTSGKPAVFPPYSTVGRAKLLTSFFNQGEAGAELATLVWLAAAGRLAVEIGWCGPWERLADAAEACSGVG